jgi:hypothetical protein
MVRPVMTQSGVLQRRAWAARICLVAIALALLVVPGLHALVHHHEAEERAAEAHEAEHRGKHGEQGHGEHEHGEHGHGEHGHAEHGEHGEHGHDSDQHARREAPHHSHHHHHRGGSEDESPLEHGDGAPEHLGLALLESEPPALPPPCEPVDSLAPPAPADCIRAAARRRAHGSRAPPGDMASPSTT